MGKVEEIGEIVKETADGTTAHGLPNIVRTKSNFVRILWICCFLAAFAYCTYTIVRSAIAYAKYDTTIQLSTMREWPTEFPTVTICNLNPFTNLKNETNNQIEEIYNYLKDNFNNKKANFKNRSNSLQSEYDAVYDKLKRIIANNVSATIKKSLGYDLKGDLLLSCTFNKKECTERDFTSFWSDDFGNCYTFNGYNTNGSSTIRSTSRAGLNYGLVMEILVGNPLWSPKYAFKEGLYLSVKNKSSVASILTGGIEIPAASHTYVGVTRTYYTKLEQPYSDCIKNMDKYKSYSDTSKVIHGYMTSFGVKEYDQQFCYALCTQDYFINNCNCCDINVPCIRNKTYCFDDSELICIKNATEKLSSADLDKICNSSCPLQCEYTTYSLNAYTSSYPSDNYLSNLNDTSPTQISINNYTAYEQLSKAYILYDEFLHSNDISSNNNLTDYSSAYDYYSDYEDESGTNSPGTSTNVIITPSDILSKIKSSLVKITVNYNDLAFTYVQDTPAMTFETLLGVLGGQLGLFIGISFLSLIELLDLFLNIIFAICNRNKTAKAAAAANGNPYMIQRTPFGFYPSYY